MDSCYSGDNMAGDHMHIDITCNIEESQQTYCFGAEGGAAKLVFFWI